MGFPHIIKDCTGRFSPVAFARVEVQKKSKPQCLFEISLTSMLATSDQGGRLLGGWKLRITEYVTLDVWVDDFSGSYLLGWFRNGYENMVSFSVKNRKEWFTGQSIS